MPEPYVLKLLRMDDGPGMYFNSWGAGITGNFASARRYNSDWQAIDEKDRWNAVHSDRALFLCKESVAEGA